MSLAGYIMPMVWSGIFTFIIFHLEKTGIRGAKLAMIGIGNIVLIPWIIILLDYYYISGLSDIWLKTIYSVIGFLLFVVIMIVMIRFMKIEEERYSKNGGDR